MRKGVLLDLVLINKEELFGNASVATMIMNEIMEFSVL